jgi:hypothetical protein
MLKMKILKKLLFLIVAITVILSMFTSVFATDVKTTLNVVQQASETKYLENDQGYISKTIVDSNASTGEVTIELKLSNTKKETETTSDTEIFLVVDNSPSMDFVTSTGQTRKEIILNSANELVESIFNVSSNVKIGLVEFHGKTSALGTWNDAKDLQYHGILRQELTNDKDTIKSAINKILNKSTVSSTDIAAGLEVAQKNFSENANNKVIVLLTDGIPNADTKGNSTGNDVTTDTALLIQSNTKQTILDLKEDGIYTITMLTGMSESDGHTDKNGNEFEQVNTLEEELAAAERVFGTKTNPTADKYYLVQSADINNVITNDILRDVTEKIQNPINTVQVVDYFPSDITENFDFSYVGTPSVGTVSEGIDSETSTIIWDIETLKGNETATLQYKLKIKDMQNAELLNKTIATNEKVILTYKDTDAKDYTVTLTSSPKIQLAEVKEEQPQETNTNNKTNTNTKNDTTTATGAIPQTGVGVGIIVAILVLCGVSVIMYVKSKNLKDIR